ncbi:MAG: histidine phosphatase family protein [Blastocatellia bacterium]|nr:histidine phosphatase family protein [Blastocatellia bacterium]
MTDALVNGTLAGRGAGMSLSEQGRNDARELPEMLAGIAIARIYSSPLERTRETAKLISDRTNSPVEVHEGLNEFDFGEFTGKSFADLNAIRQWQLFNTFRSSTRMPGGETILDVQQRMVSAFEDIRRKHAGHTVAVVSHGDPLRSVIVHYAGMHLDHLTRLELFPGSVSILRVGDDQARIVALNCLPSLARTIEFR